MTAWMMNGDRLQTLIAADAALAQKFFGTPAAFVIGAAPAGWATTPVADFSSYAGYHADSGTHPWVMYDTEKWAGTPAGEQQKPREFLAAFADLAHSRGAKVIEAPARDLCSVTGGDFHVPGLGTDAAYLKAQVPAACYRADVFHCQAQADQGHTATYAALVTQARKQTPPCQPMWAGLTTMRATDTAQQLIDCYTATVGTVDGYWLNTSIQNIGMVVELLSGIA